MMRRAGDEPSIGVSQIERSRVNATASDRGETAGPSPSPSARGSPPSNGAAMIWTRGGVGRFRMFTGAASSQFELKSPPRMNTTHFPSSEICSDVISCPSSTS
jgi:hypothetical protein